MTGVLDSLASQIGASVEATRFLLSLFIGKANSCVFKIDVSRKLRYAVLRCSCVFLKLGPVGYTITKFNLRISTCLQS